MAKIDRASSIDPIKSGLGESTEGQAATVRVGESKLSEVAKRLGVGEGSLREANPHISDVNKLTVGQELQLPSQKKGEAQNAVGAESAKSQLKPDLPPAPKGDPIAASVIKASLNDANTVSSLSLPQLESLITKAVTQALSQLPSPFQLGQRAAGVGISQLGSGASDPHANSGPPGFANSGGHANFDPKSLNPGLISQLGISQLGQRAAGVGISQLRSGASDPHANSGPPGFANSGGHANFDPKSLNSGNTVMVTLPDSTNVTLPAQGRVNLAVNGFLITR